MQKPKPTAHSAVLQIVRKEVEKLSTQDQVAQGLLFDLKEDAQLYQRLYSEKEAPENPARAVSLWDHMEQLRIQLKRKGCNLNAFNLEEVIPAILKMKGDPKIKIVSREPEAPVRMEEKKIPKEGKKGDFWEEAGKIFRN